MLMGVRLNSSLLPRQLELDLKFPNHFTFPGLRKVSGPKTLNYSVQTRHFATSIVPKGEIFHSIELHWMADSSAEVRLNSHVGSWQRSLTLSLPSLYVTSSQRGKVRPIRQPLVSCHLQRRLRCNQLHQSFVNSSGRRFEGNRCFFFFFK